MTSRSKLALLAFATLAAPLAVASSAQEVLFGVTATDAPKGKQGILVDAVTPDSPAAKAGITRGDILLRIGTREVADLDAYANAFEGVKAGSTLRVELLRGGDPDRKEAVEVTVAPWRAPAPSTAPPRGGLRPVAPRLKEPAAPRPGMRVAPPAASSPRVYVLQAGGPFLGVISEAEQDGHVVIRDVTPESAAQAAGLKPGDEIVRIADKEISSQEDLHTQIQAHKPGDLVKIKILREGKESELDVKLGSRPQTLADAPDVGIAFEGTPPIPADIEREVKRQLEMAERVRSRALDTAGVSPESVARLRREVAELKEEMKSLREQLADLRQLLKELRSTKGSGK
ncbi:MAG: PDZ domain-containing protein [Planctomycetes bacterium]|nr:PDZ domain-containing protein [Planctomycetota bacterium]